MRRLSALGVAAGALLLASPVAGTPGGRPVALVTAETSNEVLAVSLGPRGGRVLRRVQLADPLMIAAAPSGPAVVVNPSGTVTLLAWNSLRTKRLGEEYVRATQELLTCPSVSPRGSCCRAVSAYFERLFQSLRVYG